MLERQRLTIHSHRQQRLSSIKRRGSRESHGEVVDGARHQLVGAGLDPGPVEQILEWNSQPTGVADQWSPHPIGDT